MHKISERISIEVKREATTGEKNGKKGASKRNEGTKRKWRDEKDAK